MRQVHPHQLWLGTAADARNIRQLQDAGIAALVDLALNEPPAPVTRELVYCRFPLVDGLDNPLWLLSAAIETTASLLRTKSPTLICCGAGMSRSPAIAAAALAIVLGKPPERCLADVGRLWPCDVSPGLWHDVCSALEKSKGNGVPEGPTKASTGNIADLGGNCQDDTQ